MILCLYVRWVSYALMNYNKNSIPGTLHKSRSGVVILNSFQKPIWTVAVLIQTLHVLAKLKCIACKWMQHTCIGQEHECEFCC